MAESNPDSTAEMGEVDREWTQTSLDNPQDNRPIDVSGVVGEDDEELSADLADARDIESKLRGAG